MKTTTWLLFLACTITTPVLAESEGAAFHEPLPNCYFSRPGQDPTGNYVSGLYFWALNRGATGAEMTSGMSQLRANGYYGLLYVAQQLGDSAEFDYYTQKYGIRQVVGQICSMFMSGTCTEDDVNQAEDLIKAGRGADALFNLLQEPAFRFSASFEYDCIAP